MCLAGCADDEPRGEDPSETAPGTSSSTPETTGSTTTPPTATATSTSGTPDPDTGEPPDTGAIPKLDVAAIPDTPGMDEEGFVGIPETCEEAEMAQSTVGCSFRANRMQNFSDYDSSLIVGNVSQSDTAMVQLYFATGGAEVAQGAPVAVGPLMSHEFVLDQPGPPGNVSVHRTEGTYRAESDIPIVAYQHSPIGAVASNDSSMLIPDHALGQFHIIATWETTLTGHSSAFNVVGVRNNTTVTWEPPNATNSGSGVPAVSAGGSDSVVIDEHDLLQVVAPTDAAGTIVETDKPAFVIGTVPCVNVPAGVTFCDHIEELMIPVEYWGTEYVAAHAPTRGSESYWWRVYSGGDGTMIDTNPVQPGFPVTLDRGEYIEFSTDESFLIDGDGAFMPVQYLEGQDAGAGTGDPAMYQMVPVEQFLPRYVFVTGTGYNENYVQVIRVAGGPDVEVDGVTVDGYMSIGGFEVADWPIAEGAHSAESEQPFGIVQVGYTAVTSYAYPGGLALGFINPNPEG